VSSDSDPDDAGVPAIGKQYGSASWCSNDPSRAWRNDLFPWAAISKLTWPASRGEGKVKPWIVVATWVSDNDSKEAFSTGWLP
jgi:hypothetical protein